MLQITSNSSRSLADLADLHFEALNEKVKTGPRKGLCKKSALTFKLEEAISSSRDEENQFFMFLKNNLKKIITGLPSELADIITAFNTAFPTLVFREKNADDKIELNHLGKKVVEIFNYTTYRGSIECTNFLAKLDMQQQLPCPYCNYDLLSIVEIPKPGTTIYDQKALLDLDHFHPQSKYPFLGVSLFNLVPSCHNCNSVFKRDKEFEINTHVHPFHSSFEDLFSFKLTSPYLSGQKAEDIDIRYTAKSSFPDNIIKDLRIIERYSAAKNEVIEMLSYLYKRPLTNLQQIDELSVQDERAQLLKFGHIPPEREDIIKYRLGKLKRDICIDLKIY